MLFSIVIPVFNREKYIVKAIDSVLRQTYKNYELIVVDDASTDNTVRVIQEKYSKDLILIKSDMNKGNASARNLGVIASKGSYICFLDSDDQFNENYLDYLHGMILENNSPGFLWVNVARIDAKGIRYELQFPKKWNPEMSKDPYSLFLKGIYFGTDFGFAVRSDIFKKVGLFDEKLRVAVDTDFILRAVRETNFAFTKRILVDTYNHTDHRVRTNIVNKIHSYERIITKHNQIHFSRDIYIIWIYKLMWMNYHVGFKKNARFYVKELLRYLHIKSFLIFLIFETCPQNFAIALHKRFS